MRRREFIAGIGSVAAWPHAGNAQKPTLPVVAYIGGGTLDTNARVLAAFRGGLNAFGYTEGKNVSVEYHLLEDRLDRIPALVDELVRRRVAVIVSAILTAVLAAKAATTTIPIVFGSVDNPVRLGLVPNLARPSGNLTGMNFFHAEAASKRLGLMHDLVPKATRLAVLVNPGNSPSGEATLREAENAARIIGLPVDVFKASNSPEIEEVFETLSRERIEVLFIAGDPYFTSRRVQLATLAASHRIATSYPGREFAEAGGLMTYGTDMIEVNYQFGLYTGEILKGAKPADLPVVQAVKLEFVINMPTARVLGIEVPPTLLAIADEVIE